MAISYMSVILFADIHPPLDYKTTVKILSKLNVE